MIEIDNVDVVGVEHAIRGMRNPMNSWDKSDSFNCNAYCEMCPKQETDCTYGFNVGDNDLDLMKRLAKAGEEHRKFMRMIVVYADITAPMYWWKEFDTYKVGTVRNSCSTMHKIHSRDLTLDDFSVETLSDDCVEVVSYVIHKINNCRKRYLDSKNAKLWRMMIEMLPSSYNQKSTVMLNYEVLANMYHSRKNHKLDEWREFCKLVEKLPYSELITGLEVK